MWFVPLNCFVLWHANQYRFKEAQPHAPLCSCEGICQTDIQRPIHCSMQMMISYRLPTELILRNLSKIEWSDTDSVQNRVFNNRSCLEVFDGTRINAINELRYKTASYFSASWKRSHCTTGVLSDRHINVKNSYFTDVSIALSLSIIVSVSRLAKPMNGCLRVMETKLIRYTRDDHIRNEDIRNRYGIGSPYKALQVEASATVWSSKLR